jgi:uncharacterized membrane protein (UPF0127 family)
MQNEKTKKIKSALNFGGAIFIIITTLVVIKFAKTSQNQAQKLKINNTTINIEIAKTSQEKAKGLCCRDSLSPNGGMLFVYDRPDYYAFWMKDTKIPLDIYWIDSGKQIIHIEENILPSSYPKAYVSKQAAQYVLETNAGFAKTHNIKVGDNVAF